MSSVTVMTKEEFEEAVMNNAEKIIITGALAQKIIKAQKRKEIGKKVAIAGTIVACVATVAGIFFPPAAVGGRAMHAAALRVGAVAVSTSSTAEIITICGTVLAALGISTYLINSIKKDYDVKINMGSNSVEFTRK